MFYDNISFYIYGAKNLFCLYVAFLYFIVIVIVIVHQNFASNVICFRKIDVLERIYSIREKKYGLKCIGPLPIPYIREKKINIYIINFVFLANFKIYKYIYILQHVINIKAANFTTIAHSIQKLNALDFYCAALKMNKRITATS